MNKKAILVSFIFVVGLMGSITTVHGMGKGSGDTQSLCTIKPSSGATSGSSSNTVDPNICLKLSVDRGIARTQNVQATAYLHRLIEEAVASGWSLSGISTVTEEDQYANFKTVKGKYKIGDFRYCEITQPRINPVNRMEGVLQAIGLQSDVVKCYTAVIGNEYDGVMSSGKNSFLLDAKILNKCSQAKNQD